MQTLVGARIRARREAVGIKQAHLAKAVGISASYLNLIEHNRRGIAGKVLIDIAQALTVSVADLNEGAEVALVQDLQTAAALGTAPVEIARLEEMIGRFPGWARLIATLSRRQVKLEHNLDALSDRLTHDPFLAESLHEVLSNVTAIRSISSILAQTGDIAPDQQARFHQNLFDESQRLAEISQALVSYFEHKGEESDSLSTPLDEFQRFLSRHDFQFAALEREGAAGIDVVLAGEAAPPSTAARQLARDFLLGQCERAVKMPLGRFIKQAKAVDFAPEALAQQFGVSLPEVFHRLASLPETPGQRRFGLVICDLSGAVMFRKSLPGFSLPKYGAACPLWPLYQSLAQPHSPVKACLETPDGQRFTAYAQSLPLQAPGFSGPRIIQAAMLFCAAPREGGAAALPIGLNCRICPRGGCGARREPSIHGG